MKQLLALLTLGFAVISAAANPSDTISAKPRYNWPRNAVSAAGAVAINATATELLKHNVHRTRPDLSDNHSFPSRHTSWAFTASTIVANELASHSPWWAVGAQAGATAIGMQRILARRHWGSDVAAGALTGIVSTQLAYTLTGILWRDPRCKFTLYPHSTLGVKSLTLTTGASFPIGRSEHTHIATAFTAALTGILPIEGRRWATTATIGMIAAPITDPEGRNLQPLTILTFSPGGRYVLPLGGAWTLEPTLNLGIAAAINTTPEMEPVGFYGTAGTDAICRITKNCAATASLRYALLTLGHTYNFVNVGLGTRVCF